MTAATRTLASRPIWLLVLAAIGGCLLVIVAAYRWGMPADEHAYWLAARRLIEGQPLYDMTVSVGTPYAYVYPPPLAQVLVPVAAILPAAWFDALWTVGMLAALWWLAGKDVLNTLALVAFPPIAIEFWFRNIHLFLAVMIVLGFQRWSGWFAIAASIKPTPGLAVVFHALRGEWRKAGVIVAVGLAILAVSVAISVDDWRAYWTFVTERGALGVTGVLPIPFLVRFAIGFVGVVIASRLRRPWAEVGFVIAMTFALPALWFTALSTLVAIVPIVRDYRAEPRAVPLS